MSIETDYKEEEERVIDATPLAVGTGAVELAVG